MIYDLYFCYRIEKEARIGEDEHGNPCEIYVQIKLGECETENLDPEQERKSHEVDGPNIIADMYHIPIELITPITLEEYAKHAEEDSSL
jgi:hypothetical protein